MRHNTKYTVNQVTNKIVSRYFKVSVARISFLCIFLPKKKYCLELYITTFDDVMKFGWLLIEMNDRLFILNKWMCEGTDPMLCHSYTLKQSYAKWSPWTLRFLFGKIKQRKIAYFTFRVLQFCFSTCLMLTICHVG